MSNVLRALVLPLLVTACSFASAEALRAGALIPPRMAPEFSLLGTHGSDVRIQGFHGEVVALSFGYTSCADVCPTTLAYLAEARKKLGADATRFQVVYVTVDPERDDVPRLRTYMNAFDPSFIGATGAPDVLSGIRRAYGVTMVKEPSKTTPTDYLIHHSAYIFLIDKAGYLRAIMPFGVTPDDIVHDVIALLGNE
jgi:protein SCO1/2